jgi:hypothetical protein
MLPSTSGKRAAVQGLRVVSITGMLSDDERRAKVEELGQEPRRVLVATDCLSEGINLQHAFNAALHYDLPWNPNRLEQREGRVDRYGQTLSNTVKTIRYFSPDNAVDGVVLRVLLDKAREIHRTLGTHVPVPEESETVTQAVLQALFFKGRTASEAMQQMELGLQVPEVAELHRRWDLDAAREKENRTRFAQRALKPAEVQRELEATDAVLGDPEAVRSFVLSAAQRLGIHVESLSVKKGVGSGEKTTVSPSSPLPSPISTLAEQSLLSLRILDPACGSGHMLLAAARRVGKELAKLRTGEDEPAPERVRESVRDVISHCIYGVDKNPLAVDLCRVALWLESHTAGKVWRPLASGGRRWTMLVAK